MLFKKSIKEGEIFENDIENKNLVLDIIDNPFFQKMMANYVIFSEAYLKRSGEFKKVKKEIVKQRADEIFENDSDNLGKNIYQDVSKLERPIKNEDFAKYIFMALSEKLELVNKLKKAKIESKDRFEKVLMEVFIELQIESATKIKKPKRPFEKIGDLYVEIVDDKCLPHLPRVAINWPETLEKIEEAFEILAEIIQKDERFKNIKEINIMSWVFGRKDLASDFDNTFKWDFYTKEEIEKIAEENPDSYKEIQKVGVKVSPREFKKYLLTGEMSQAGGRKISKEKFIQNMERLKKLKIHQ